MREDERSYPGRNQTERPQQRRKSGLWESQSAPERMGGVLSLWKQHTRILKNAESRERTNAKMVVEETQQKAWTLQPLPR